MDHSSGDEPLILTTEDRAGRFERWTMSLVLSGTGIGLTGGMYASKYSIDVSLVVGIGLLDLIFVVVSLAEFLNPRRGTWLLDHHHIEFRSCAGCSTMLRWAEMDKILLGGGHFIFRGKGLQIAIPRAIMRRGTLTQVCAKIHKELAASFELSDLARTSVDVKDRALSLVDVKDRAFSVLRAMFLMTLFGVATLAGGCLLTLWIAIPLRRAGIHLSDSQASWIFLLAFALATAIGVTCFTWWNPARDRELRRTHPQWPWRNRLP